MKFEDKVKLLREKKYKGRETSEFLSDVKKIADGELFEYVLGLVDFCGAKIDLSYRPMIPRSETAYWVERAMQQIVNSNKQTGIRVLDTFSGSGAIGVAVAKYFQKSTVDGYVECSEFDEKLLPQIVKNMDLNKIDSLRYKVFQGDVFVGADRTYDFIFAVPPYVDPHNKEEVMKELHAEPELSFFDKEDGYYYHKQVLENAKSFLKKGGKLCLEFDITQRQKIEELAKGFGWKNYDFLKDPYGHEYVIVCTTD